MALALADSHAHLEAKVRDRTAALSATTQKVQQQAGELGQLNVTLAETLQDARRRKDDAEAANAAKSRFLAAASHDLRQPMHAISLLVGLLSQDVRGADSDVLIRKVQGSVEAMEDLFVSLLDISKLDAGAMRPLIEDFAIEEILERARRSFTPVAEKKGIVLDIESCAAIVRSDPALLERILFNLVSNGIRYTFKGHVRVSCVPIEAALRLCIEDTGIGIPAEHHERIFEEFFQIASPTGSRSGGLGLGLSIVRRCAGPACDIGCRCNRTKAEHNFESTSPALVAQVSRRKQLTALGKSATRSLELLLSLSTMMLTAVMQWKRPFGCGVAQSCPPIGAPGS